LTRKRKGGEKVDLTRTQEMQELTLPADHGRKEKRQNKGNLWLKGGRGFSWGEEVTWSQGQRLSLSESGKKSRIRIIHSWCHT
jgi:hypothetical protein